MTLYEETRDELKIMRKKIVAMNTRLDKRIEEAKELNTEVKQFVADVRKERIERLKQAQNQ